MYLLQVSPLCTCHRCHQYVPVTDVTSMFLSHVSPVCTCYRCHQCVPVTGVTIMYLLQVSPLCTCHRCHQYVPVTDVTSMFLSHVSPACTCYRCHQCVPVTLTCPSLFPCEILSAVRPIFTHHSYFFPCIGWSLTIVCVQLTYDYKFDLEDDQHKIPCLCGATFCRKWMN